MVFEIEKVSPRRSWFRNMTTITFGFIILLAAALAFAHGGKKHGSSFTPLQALQKGTELYDKLVVSGKLAESWETDLEEVKISDRQKDGQKEYIVSFERSGGDPSTVYIFFTSDGKYAGSNFTGD